MEVYTTTPLISMMIRTAGSKRNNSLSGYHIADPSAARIDDLVMKVGVDGSYEDEVMMGCVGWVGSQIRQHGACDGDESQDDSGDGNSQCSSLQQIFRIATQTD